MKLTPDQLHAYALVGAKAQLETIYAAFPQLREGGNGATAGTALATPAASLAQRKTATKRKGHTKTLAQRKAIGRRMKAWHKARRVAADAKGAGR